MAISLKHNFTSSKPDGTDTTMVQPSNWNAEHTLTQATNKLLGRTTALTGATEEISVGSNLTFSSLTLSLASTVSLTALTSASLTVTGAATFSSTDAVKVPAGTIAQRVSTATGAFRFNTDYGKFEGYNGTTWGSVGGGATGGGSDAVFMENDVAITTNYTITTGKNALTAGPITVNAGVSVTIPSGSVWTIV